ncbi:cullin-4B [Eremomyces bilateralis CBS 781.70]|uniref:Cullin-4B n=1 Tax=Eremomyces bilateralis CBS 781.70 TaxID=1392243 RepID=A0A6G1GBB0_9PEZI|nr:cullin-4B [Eremomyces bilateralis CBS 781.70]KAF1815226.1 cullin-4B [Eremomyces bilateralis CBS 781.70]
MYAFKSKRNGGQDEVVDLTGPNRPAKGAVRNGKLPFDPQIGAKRLVVKNRRTSTRLDPKQYLETAWSRLDTAIDVILADRPIDFSLEELYKGVENVCRQNMAQELTELLKSKLGAYASGSMRAQLRSRLGGTNVDFLQGTVSIWGKWLQHMVMIRSIFSFLDQTYLLAESLPTIKEIAIGFFRDEILGDVELKGKVLNGVCDLVEADRTGRTPDLSLFRESIRMFREISSYTTVLEPKMHHASQIYVREWANEADAKSLSDYVKSASELIQREVDRCDLFSLDVSTRRDLVTLLEEHLIVSRKDRLVGSGEFQELMDKAATDDLRRLYSLLQRRRLGSKLQPPFEQWIDQTGTSIIFDEKEQDHMVVRLLSLKKQLDRTWKIAFERDDDLGHAMKTSFEFFINKTRKTSATWNTDNSKPAEMIAKYLDLLLQGGSKAIPSAMAFKWASTAKPDEEGDADQYAGDEDAEVNNQLDQALDLFRFVHGKQVFEAFYKKDLARRLLMGRSASADAEMSMITRLKTECGAEFTKNLERMFSDISLSREEMASYKAIAAEREEYSPIDLNVTVLSSSAWPSYKDLPFILPPDVKVLIDKFEESYRSKHSNHKLDWKHGLVTCHVRADFPKGKKELVLSGSQTIVILVFNQFLDADDKVPYSVIKAETGLDDAELKRTLQSLACARIRPLKKHPKGREVDETDSFSWNADFRHEKQRLKVNQVQLKETREENKATHERVHADRQFETQAAIVRILKSRQSINHNHLITEVIEATKKRGALDVGDIKRNIDKLIDKDYMVRDGETGMYNYIA